MAIPITIMAAFFTCLRPHLREACTSFCSCVFAGRLRDAFTFVLLFACPLDEGCVFIRFVIACS
jgi:hypothetical protein